MKKLLSLAACAAFGIMLVQTPACKKDPVTDNRLIFKEEFKDVPGLQATGWMITTYYYLNSGPQWGQGRQGVDKFGVSYGFPAYSYENSKTEYAYISFSGYPGADSLSAWLITPTLTLHDGDKISFYTRGEASGATDRLQIRLNPQDASTDVGSSNTSVGRYTLLLHAVNPGAANNGYPVSWTKQELVVSGLGGERSTRLAFRYNPNTSASSGIGIDKLEITRP